MNSEFLRMLLFCEISYDCNRNGNWAGHDRREQNGTTLAQEYTGELAIYRR